MKVKNKSFKYLPFIVGVFALFSKCMPPEKHPDSNPSLKKLQIYLLNYGSGIASHYKDSLDLDW